MIYKSQQGDRTHTCIRCNTQQQRQQETQTASTWKLLFPLYRLFRPNKGSIKSSQTGLLKCDEVASLSSSDSNRFLIPIVLCNWHSVRPKNHYVSTSISVIVKMNIAIHSQNRDVDIHYSSGFAAVNLILMQREQPLVASIGRDWASHRHVGFYCTWCNWDFGDYSFLQAIGKST